MSADKPMNPPVWIEVRYAITLTQPWATLMALGEKLIETRGRRTNFRGWIAIHAAKGFPAECRELCYRQPFATRLAHHGYQNPGALPLGDVLAVTQIIGCEPTEKFLFNDGPRIAPNERAFGNYDPGRYGYITHGLRRLRWTFAARGAQTIPWKLPRTITEADLI